MENIVNPGWGIKPVSMRTNNLRDGKFSIPVVEFLRGPVRFDILEIEPDLIPNTEANRWLTVTVCELLLLLLGRGHRGLGPIPCLTQLVKDTLSYLDRGLTRWPELFHLECERFHVVSMTQEERAHSSRRGVAVIDRQLCGREERGPVVLCVRAK